MPLREYLTKVKTICDFLGAAGHAILDTKQILSILSGLDDDYELVAIVISSKETTPSLSYVHYTLLVHEGRIEQKKLVVLDVTVNYTSNGKSINQERNSSSKYE